MSRHVADQPRARREGARVAPYLEAARREADLPHPAARALHRQPRARAGDGLRAAEFLRIARGRSA